MATGFLTITRPEIYYGEIAQRVRVRQHALAGARLPPGRPERLHTLRGHGRDRASARCWRRSPSPPGSARSRSSCPTTSRRRAGSSTTGKSARGCSGSRRSSASTAIPTWWSPTPGGSCGWWTATPRPTAIPYSAAGLRGMGNYIRNSVKVTVDAYDGAVTFYVADPDDPIDPDLRAGVPRAAPAACSRCPRTCAATSATPRTLRDPGADVRHLPHGGPAGLLQQGGPLGGAAPDRRRAATREMEPYYTIMRLPGREARGVHPPHAVHAGAAATT